jgi:hypothetical protein
VSELDPYAVLAKAMRAEREEQARRIQLSHEMRIAKRNQRERRAQRHGHDHWYRRALARSEHDRTQKAA